MMKLALQEVQPWAFRTLCLMIGGVALLALTRASGGTVRVPGGRLPPLALVALFNITAWHLFSAYALLNTGSGRAAIIGYTMPLWASLLSVWVLGARLDRAPGRGAAARHGRAGAADRPGFRRGRRGAARRPADARRRAQLGDRHGAGQEVRLGRPAGHRAHRLAAADRRRCRSCSAGGCSSRCPISRALSLPAALGLAYAVFVATIFCQTAYFKLLSLLPAHVAAISVLPVPVVGVVSSALLLGEPVGLAEIAALTLVVGGLFLLIRPADR